MRTLPGQGAYLAQTPFEIEENNVRLSAQRYQDRARDALRVQSVDRVAQRSVLPITVGALGGLFLDPLQSPADTRYRRLAQQGAKDQHATGDQ